MRRVAPAKAGAYPKPGEGVIVGWGALPGVARADRRRIVAACATVAALAAATALWALYAAGVLVTALPLLVAWVQILIVRRASRTAGPAGCGGKLPRPIDRYFG